VGTATFSDFIPIALTLTPDAHGYLRLPTKFYEKYIKNRKPIPTTALLKEEQRDLSWYVDTSVSTTKPVVYPATCSVSESVVGPLPSPAAASRLSALPPPSTSRASLSAAHETLLQYMRRSITTAVTTKVLAVSAVMELASPLRNGS
jgi:hypothetical protein